MEVFVESVSILDSISNQDSSTINSEILDSVLDEEPIATEQEIAEYQQQVDEELEQQQMLQDRFDRKSELRSWCHCSQCSVELVAKPEECFCCTEIDRCKEILEELDIDECCITSHPGFLSVCLDEWVLQIAAIGLQTRRKKRYTVLFDQGITDKAQFLRSVSYRQFTRLVWEYMGYSKRLPLPCCAYNAIRGKFPSEDGEYKGYEDEEVVDEEGESDNFE
ncbi:hypothetical protein QZH41_013140, partial [Actinostola sp. cb2023]